MDKTKMDAVIADKIDTKTKSVRATLSKLENMIRRTTLNNSSTKNSKGGAKQADRAPRNKKTKSQSCHQEESSTQEATKRPTPTQGRCRQRFLKKKQWQELKTQAKEEAWKERQAKRKDQCLEALLFDRYGVVADPDKPVNYNTTLALLAMPKWYYFSRSSMTLLPTIPHRPHFEPS
jgi:hypothetical protein